MNYNKYDCLSARVKFRNHGRPSQRITMGDGPTTAHFIRCIQNEFFLSFTFCRRYDDALADPVKVICFNWADIEEYELGEIQATIRPVQTPPSVMSRSAK